MGFVKIFIFNRMMYFIATVSVFILCVISNRLFMYFMLGALTSIGVYFIEYEKFKKIMLAYGNETIRWYHYLPVGFIDFLFWPYALLGITGDILIHKTHERELDV